MSPPAPSDARPVSAVSLNVQMPSILRTLALLSACCSAAAPQIAAQSGAGANAAQASAATTGAREALTADARDVDPTSIYRVGAGDILDIRLLNAPRAARRSTLYVVGEDGTLDYPLAGKARAVAGLTTDEIAAQLASSFRLRALFAEPPRLVVTVREYASHAVNVGGLVAEPGVKIIQREAIPLYVLVADAQPRKGAGRAVIDRRAGGAKQLIDLADAEALKTLVRPGDTVTLEEQPPQFFRIEGLVREPGRKSLHAGMTLTQALMLAGGVQPKGVGIRELGQLMVSDGLLSRERKEFKAIVERRGADGQLTKAVYVLKEIEAGRVPDPLLREDDRVIVLR